MGNEKKATNNTIQTVDRALRILEILSSSPLPLSAISISKKLNINRTTTYGLLRTLVSNKYLYKDPDGKYFMSPKMFTISCFYPYTIRHLQLMMPLLVKVASSFPNFSLHYGFFNQDNKVQNYKLQMPFSEKMLPNSSIVPMHASGIGKVMLAFLPRKQMCEIIENMKLESHTQFTITNKTELFKELDNILELGYALDRGEFFDNTFCVAFPIFDSNNEIISSFSLSGQKSKIENSFQDIISLGLQISKQSNQLMI